MIISDHENYFPPIVKYLNIPTYLRIVNGAIESELKIREYLSPPHSMDYNLFNFNIYPYDAFPESEYQLRFKNYFSHLHHKVQIQPQLAQTLLEFNQKSREWASLENKHPDLIIGLCIDGVAPPISSNQATQTILPNFHGKMQNDFQYNNIPDQITRFIDQHEKIVIVSFGTYFRLNVIQEAALQQFMEDQKDFAFIVKMKYFDDENQEDIDQKYSHNPRILRMKFIPQKWLLQQDKVKYFLTHGGQNSVTEGLQSGKPMIVFPQGANDQHMFCHFLEVKLGFGVCIRDNLRTSREYIARTQDIYNQLTQAIGILYIMQIIYLKYKRMENQIYFSKWLASHKAINEGIVLVLADNPKLNISFVTNSGTTTNPQEFLNKGVNLIVPQYDIEDEAIMESLSKSQNMDRTTAIQMKSFNRIIKQNYKFDVLISDAQSLGSIIATYLNIDTFVYVSNAPIEQSTTIIRNQPPFHSTHYTKYSFNYFRDMDPYPQDELRFRFTSFLSEILRGVFLKENAIYYFFQEYIDERFIDKQLKQADLSLTLNIDGFNPPIPMTPENRFIFPKYKRVAQIQTMKDDLNTFLNTHQNIVLIAFGSYFKPDLELQLELKSFINYVINQSGKQWGVILVQREFDLNLNSSNLYISDRIPQVEVLQHKNLKLFLTHGGQNSMIESVEAGVPVIVMPQGYFDQHLFCHYAESIRIGKCYRSFSHHQNQLIEYFNSITQNINDYKLRLENYSYVIKFERENCEDINHWVDSLIESGNEILYYNHLRKMNIYQRTEIDIYLTIGLCFYIAFKICIGILSKAIKQLMKVL
eukprot:403346971